MALFADGHAVGLGLTMADIYGHKPRGLRGLLRAARWSWKGIRAAWLNESSFRLEVVVAVVMAPFGVWLGADGVQRALLVGSLFLVLGVELINSAIETIIERYGSEYHELAGRAKDMGSAAVAMAILNMLACWGLILGPPLYHLVVSHFA